MVKEDDDLQKGIQFFKEEKYELAHKHLLSAVKKKEYEAFFYLGDIYFYGYHFDKDELKGLEYYKKAADLGGPAQKFYYGYMLYKGIKVSQNVEQSIYYLKLAADAGSTRALNHLGIVYNSVINPKKPELAVSYFKQAADMGEHAGQYNLAQHYEESESIQDKVLMAKYYKMSADGGFKGAAYKIGQCYQNGNGIELNHTLAAHYYRLGAESGDQNAQSNLGLLYAKGLGVERNYDLAARYFKLAADQNLPEAQYNYALTLLKKGEDKEAAKYLNLAAQSGDEDASKKLEQLNAKKQRTRPQSSNADINGELEKLNSLIGIDSVKSEITGFVDFITIRKLRESHGLPVPGLSLHLSFTGNPGTGKTTVARIIGGIYKALGLLSSGHVVEVLRQDLVGRYIGETAPKTQLKIDEAMDGVLFIDEAYTLSQGGKEWDYGPEAIATILAGMENNRDRLAVITAGYKDKMDDFFASNQGLASRFSRVVNFPDYSPPELTEIFLKFAESSQYKVDASAKDSLGKHFEDIHKKRDANFGNGRVVRNLFEASVQKQCTRLVEERKTDRSSLITITKKDLAF